VVARRAGISSAQCLGTVAVAVGVAVAVFISAGLGLMAMLVGVVLGVMFVPVVAHVAAADALCVRRHVR
jgi:type IV secretory pathway TrbD component